MLKNNHMLKRVAEVGVGFILIRNVLPALVFNPVGALVVLVLYVTVSMHYVRGGICDRGWKALKKRYDFDDMIVAEAVALIFGFAIVAKGSSDPGAALMWAALILVGCAVTVPKGIVMRVARLVVSRVSAARHDANVTETPDVTDALPAIGEPEPEPTVVTVTSVPVLEPYPGTGGNPSLN